MRRSMVWKCLGVMIVASIVYVSQPTRDQSILAPESAIAGEADAAPEMLWNEVSSNARFRVHRTRVPGGWFVHVRDGYGLRSRAESVGGTFFYPDPEYKWDGTSEPR